MRIKFAFVLVLFIGMLSNGCQEPAQEIQQYTIEQFLDTTSIFGGSFSHDESKLLFSSNKTGIYNAYTIATEGGEPVQLTNSTGDSIFALSFFPGDDRILYQSDQGGNEISHIFLREEDGTVRDLIPEAEARAVFYGWSHDEKSFFFGSNARNPSFMDAYEVKIEDLEPKLVFENDEGYELGGISDDKRYLALVKVITEHNNDLYLYDRESEKLAHLSPHEGDVNHSPQYFSPDSSVLYYLTDQGSEFTYLLEYNIESGESRMIEKADWDIASASRSRTGKYRVVAINNDAQTEIRVTDTETSQQVILPDLPNAEVTSVGISKSEKWMRFYVNGSRAPSNLYVYSFETGQFKQLTDTMNPEIRPDDLVEAEVIRYKSYDGLEIPAIYYKPLKASPVNKVPALVWVHGGPGGQSRVGYSPVIQYLANHGYAVLAVNNRGSSGYGKTFFGLDDRRHGEDDLADCVQAKGFLIGTGHIDPEKIGIIGGSYGGYMVLAALTFAPDEFTVGVDLFGISNWVRTLESIPPWWGSFKDALYAELGNPETDRERLHRISPLFHSDNIQKPLMVLQGANDPRVIKAESDDIVEAVRKNNVPVEYLVFEDEGHGFVKKENQIKGYRGILEFLDKHLK